MNQSKDNFQENNFTKKQKSPEKKLNVQELKEANRFWKFWAFLSIICFVLSVLQLRSLGQNFTPLQTLKTVFQKSEKNQETTTSLDLNSMENLKKVEALIQENYVGEKPTALAIEDGIIKGYVESLGDEYSSFMTSEESKNLLDYIDERYVGIGVVFEDKLDKLEVMQVFENSPASDAGIKEGDAIVSVNEKLISEYKPATLAVNDIKGEENTTVNLGILKKDSTNLEKIEVYRRAINVPLVNLTYANNEEIAKITITSFGSDVDTLFAEKLKIANENPKTKLLVLDVRSNGGGYLDAAIDIVSHFTEEGKTIVYEESKDETVEHKAIQKDVKNKLPVVVLVNEYSASASEITAIALKELMNATIIGQTTFGKGVVQAMYSGKQFKDGQALKITVAEWLGPNKTKINKVGVKPDIETEKEQDAFEIVKNNFDIEQKRLK